MKLLTLSLLVFIFNGGLQQDSPSTATPTDATSGLSPVTPTQDSNNNGEKRSFPIIIPYNNSLDVKNIQPHWGTCLLYLEGITIVAIDHGTSKTGGQKAVFAHITGAQDTNTWIFSSESINCNIKSGPTKDTILNGSFAEYEL